jgi:AraC-like DNA-binding protein
MLLAASEQSATPGSVLRNPLVAAPFAEAVVNGFLLAAHAGYASSLKTSANPAPSGVIRTAVDLIEDDPAFPWTPETIAGRCYVRPRTLQDGFRRHLGTTPMEYVRMTRLRRVHRELGAASAAETTVTSVAYRWGLTHLSRFAAACKKLYGESPGRTLRKE